MREAQDIKLIKRKRKAVTQLCMEHYTFMINMGKRLQGVLTDPEAIPVHLK